MNQNLYRLQYISALVLFSAKYWCKIISLSIRYIYNNSSLFNGILNRQKVDISYIFDNIFEDTRSTYIKHFMIYLNHSPNSFF